MRGGVIISVGYFFGLAMSFVSKLLIAQGIGKTNYGTVVLGMTVFTFAHVVTLLGVHQGVGRYLPRYDDIASRRSALFSAFQIAVPAGLLAVIVLVVASERIATLVFQTPSLTPIIVIFALAVPFAVVMKISIGGIQGLQRSAPKVGIQNIVLPGTRFGGIAIVLLLGLGKSGVASAYLFSYVTASFVGVYYLWRATDLLSSFEFDSMRKQMFTFSAPLMIAQTMNVVFSNVDTLMIGYFWNPDHVGIYNAAFPIANLFTAVVAAFGFISMPVLSELDTKETNGDMRDVYQSISKWIFVASFPLLFFVSLFPDEIIRYTFGSEYATGALALVVLSVGLFIHAIFGPNGSTLKSIGASRPIMFDNALTALLNVVLNLLLIPRFSYLGAAISTTITYGILNLLYSYQLYSRAGIHPFSSTFTRICGASFILLGVSHVMKQTALVESLIANIGLIFMFGIVYLILLLRLGAIREPELLIIVNLEDKYGVDLSRMKQIINRITRKR